MSLHLYSFSYIPWIVIQQKPLSCLFYASTHIMHTFCFLFLSSLTTCRHTCFNSPIIINDDHKNFIRTTIFLLFELLPVSFFFHFNLWMEDNYKKNSTSQLGKICHIYPATIGNGQQFQFHRPQNSSDQEGLTEVSQANPLLQAGQKKNQVSQDLFPAAFYKSLKMLTLQTLCEKSFILDEIFFSLMHN